MTSSFYRAFEERYRRSRELIKERQLVYLPFIEPLRLLYDPCTVLDLGCGRGEWLELLQEKGFQARGVNLDEGMPEACRQLNLPAERGDAIAALREVPDASLAVISCFHIAEHIPFASLQILMTEALRALKPGGVLILETPNAENLVVASSSFYLDSIHERPIPHQLLDFLACFSGFVRTKLLRLNEEPHLARVREVDLINVLGGGGSPDYAIIVQKQADVGQLVLFDPVFTREYGLALDVLVHKYDAGLERKLDELRRENDEAPKQLLEMQLQRAEERMTRLEGKRNAALVAAAQSAAQAQVVLDSLSWRLTAPLRGLKMLLREAGTFWRGSGVVLSRAGGRGLRFMLQRGRRLAAPFRRFPRLYWLLRKYGMHVQRWAQARSGEGQAAVDASRWRQMRDDSSSQKEALPRRRLKGQHDEHKSPLEAWFYD